MIGSRSKPFFVPQGQPASYRFFPKSLAARFYTRLRLCGHCRSFSFSKASIKHSEGLVSMPARWCRTTLRTLFNCTDLHSTTGTIIILGFVFAQNTVLFFQSVWLILEGKLWAEPEETLENSWNYVDFGQFSAGKMFWVPSKIRTVSGGHCVNDLVRDMSSCMMVRGFFVTFLHVCPFAVRAGLLTCAVKRHFWRRWSLCRGQCPASHTDHLNTTHMSFFLRTYHISFFREECEMKPTAA